MVDKTTIKERLMMGDVLQEPFVKIEKASDLLYTVWEEFFSMRKQQPINEGDAERIGTALWFVYDALFNALTEFELKVSDPYSDRAKMYLEEAKAYDLALQVFEAHKKAVDVAWKTVPEKITAACNLPDAEALPKLQEIIKEVTA